MVWSPGGLIEKREIHCNLPPGSPAACLRSYPQLTDFGQSLQTLFRKVIHHHSVERRCSEYIALPRDGKEQAMGLNSVDIGV
jgi:hypothetical protein